MLTESEVIPYLLGREFISLESIVEGDVMVVDASRRNHNFRVIGQRGPSFLLKQGVGRDGPMTIAHEATVYATLQAIADGDGLDRYLPRFYAYDPAEDVLILELVRDAENLREHYWRTGRCSTTLSAAMGRVLATLHRLPARTIPAIADASSKHLAAKAAAFYLHRPGLELLRDFSNACIELVQMVQQSVEMCCFLEDLRRNWRQQTFIHYDIRWDNVLVPAPTASKGTGLKLVDWESAGLGDPCWDVGAVFGDHLSFWLSSIPVTGHASPDRYLELARHPLETIQPAVRTFWQAYVRRMELDAASSDEWLVRSARYAALKLIQTGLEQVQTSAEWTITSACHLQLAVNIIQRPEESVIVLLGIPFRGMRA